jgi:HEAT repeat protein
MRLRRVAQIEALRALPTEDRSKLALALRTALRAPGMMVRTQAIELAMKHQLRELEPHVRRRLADRSQYVRYAAVEYLGQHYENSGLPATWLYPLLQDEDFLTRVQTIESLEQIADRKAIPLIAKLLHDPESLVRSYAAGALGFFKAKRYIGTIRRLLANEQEDDPKPFAVRALFELGDEKQFDALLALLTSGRYIARCAAANSLAAMNLDAIRMQQALDAVTQARLHFLHRADQSTMEVVERQLRDELSVGG